VRLDQREVLHRRGPTAREVPQVSWPTPHPGPGRRLWHSFVEGCVGLLLARGAPLQITASNSACIRMYANLGPLAAMPARSSTVASSLRVRCLPASAPGSNASLLTKRSRRVRTSGSRSVQPCTRGALNASIHRMWRQHEMPGGRSRWVRRTAPRQTQTDRGVADAVSPLCD